MSKLNEVLIKFWESNPEKIIKMETITLNNESLEKRFENEDNFRVLKITPLPDKELMWEVVAFIQVSDKEMFFIESNVNIEIVSANKNHSFYAKVLAAPSDTIEESINYLAYNLPEGAQIRYTEKDAMYHYFRVLAKHAGIVPSSGDIEFHTPK